MDAVLLARLQFAMTIGFHFLFPPISIGLAWLLVVVEGLGWRRGDGAYERLGKFFGRILGLTFALGVATGIVMEFQFGTNWSAYSRFVGDIFGAPLAAEGVFAFFLESGFLGLYLFGRHRVSKGMHWLSILMVAVGATISAFWIIVANSWQQTPAGFVVRNGRAELTSFAAAVGSAIQRVALCCAPKAGPCGRHSSRLTVSFPSRTESPLIWTGKVAFVWPVMKGSVPFHGDYHAVASQRYLPDPANAGSWIRNRRPQSTAGCKSRRDILNGTYMVPHVPLYNRAASPTLI